MSRRPARPVARWGTAAAGLALFLAVLAVYLDSKVHSSFDSRWSLHEIVSLLRSGDLDLDEYRTIVPPGDYRVEEVDGHLRSIFPPGTMLLAAPAVALVDGVERARGADLYSRLRRRPPAHDSMKLEKTVASLLVAAAAALLFPLARRRGLRPAAAAGVVLAFALASPAWSLASRGLWQHGPLMLCLVLTLWLFARARELPAAAAWTALPLAFAFLVRPTGAIPLLVFAGLVATRHRRWLAAWLGLAAAVLVPFVLWSHAVYGAWLPPYYRAGRLALHADFLQALAANLVSPARGLLVYAPWVALAAAGRWLRRRRAPGEGERPAAGREDALEVAAALVCLFHWLTVSAFPHWWAGHGYGPRFLSDPMPLLAWLAMPAVAALWPGEASPPAPAPPDRRVGLSPASRRWLRALAAAALAWGLFVNFRGARDWGPWRWDAAPVDVDRAPQRVWDWRDPPFLR